MTKRIFKILYFLTVALVVLGAAIFTGAQQRPESKHNARPESPVPAPDSIRSVTNTGDDNTRFSYEFSQPQFQLRHILIEHDSKGRGQITLDRLNEETPIVEMLEISPVAWGRISALWQALQFLDSDINYQSDRQFPHLGTMRITMVQGSRKRTAEFNWSNNKEATALVTEYRRVADQSNLVFELSVARENQPLNTPKLMDLFESMLKRNWLSDPQQLIPLLKEISMDEHLPLIARNHALRLLKKLEK